MSKMTKEKLQETLLKSPDSVTLDELKSIFGIFCFQIKEYETFKYNLCFEIHFKRVYIIQLSYPIGNGLMSFRNEFINTDDGSFGIAMAKAKNLIELLKVFINMFHENLLLKARWEIEYDEENSNYDSLEEAQEYLAYVQLLMNDVK